MWRNINAWHPGTLSIFQSSSSIFWKTTPRPNWIKKCQRCLLFLTSPNSSFDHRVRWFISKLWLSKTTFFISRFLQCFQSAEKRNLGMLLRWLINDQNRTFFGMKLPTGFQLIGQTTLRQYTAWLDYFDRQSKMENPAFVTRVTKRAYARVGVSSAFFLTKRIPKH